jgi:hypothetical protein
MDAHSEQLSRKNVVAQRWGVVLLVLNLVGAVIYVWAASHGWVLPQERGLHSVTAEPYIWALFVFPVCIVYLVLNATWGAFILARKEWRSSVLWLSIIPIWLVALVIDFVHH